MKFNVGDLIIDNYPLGKIGVDIGYITKYNPEEEKYDIVWYYAWDGSKTKPLHYSYTRLQELIDTNIYIHKPR